ncbi:tyrosine-protein kinase family protein [Paenochrobactrum pullorum]|uniref:tyrosine-protein kinase family protein n=1 Tax=Paenochrobactrum pullorum TaxID=1324351 RepID=UPI0035BC209B
MSGKDMKRGFSFKEADIDSTVLFKSILHNLYLIIGSAALMGLIAWVVCYLIYPDILIAASLKTGSSHAVLSFKIISACCISGFLLIATMVILSELMSGRALIAPFIEQKNVIEDELRGSLQNGSLVKKSDEDNVMSEEKPKLQSGINLSDFGSTFDKMDIDYTINSFARALHYLDISRIVTISAEGDDGAVVTLELVRELADRGSRVILVDMTGTGAVSATMLDGHYEAGLTDLLIGRVRFADAIHADHYSDAHVMPLGSSNPSEAMLNEKDLSLIIGALETVYDCVVLECGPSWAEDITALITDKTQIALTIYNSEREIISDHAKDLAQNGYISFIRLHASEAAAPSTR